MKTKRRHEVPTDPNTHPNRQPRFARRRVFAGTLLAVLLSLTVAACGSSSGASSKATSTSASAGKAGAQNPQRFAALRSCLAKQGITLPTPPAGRRPPSQGGPAVPGGRPFGGAGGPALPSGVSRAQYQAALKKCGAGNLRAGNRFNSAGSKAALTRFAACMRENGVNLPAPNTSGSGPVFNTKGIDVKSSAFTAAEAKCRTALPGGSGAGGGSS
jgi:hypothetical protein